MFGLPTCRQVAHRLSRSQEHGLRLRERIGIGVHLLMCHHCRVYARQLRQLTRLVREAVTRSRDLSLAPDARERIRRAVKGRQQEQRDRD